MQRRCRGCSAPIVWLTTERGKKMPCDAVPVRYRIGGKERIVTPDGRVVAGSFDATGDYGYTPHMAVCPKRGCFIARENDRNVQQSNGRMGNAARVF